MDERLSSGVRQVGTDAELLYKATFHALPIASVLTDDRGVIADANRAAASFLNVAQSVLVTRPLLNFVARRDTRPFRKLVGELGSAAIEPFVVKLRPRGGTPRPMTMTVVRIEDRSIFLWFLAPEHPDGTSLAMRFQLCLNI